ncbi:MAG TPA: hypothetical protein VGH38_21045 [Bryobacteraceae bacterium]
MYTAGLKFAALLMVAFLVAGSQCVAVCSIQNDVPAPTHCRHHPGNSRQDNSGTPQNCAAQQPYFARSSSERSPLIVALLHPESPAASPLAVFPPDVPTNASPPLPLSSPSISVLRI